MKRHNWNVLIQIPITEIEAIDILQNKKLDKKVTLKDIEYMQAGCLDCEQPLSKELFATKCKKI